MKTLIFIGREVLNLICPQCPALSFRQLSDLKGHLDTEHGIKDMAIDELSDVEDNEDIQQEDGQQQDILNEKVVIYKKLVYVN